MADRLMDKSWERIQQKTFTKWVNSHLSKRSMAIDDLQTDFNDGLKLIAFLEVISNRTFPYKYDKKPRLEIHRIQNVGAALKYIEECKVKLISISAEDIVQKNLKLILGMIWTIIQKFSIEDISEEELSSKEALLLWCKKKTHGYRQVQVDNFHLSFQDGLAFCALIHRHRPDLLDFDKCSKSTPRENLKYAFEVAERDLGIPQLLDVDDIVDVVRPDERSVMTYVAQYYHKFASSRKQEVAGRRVGRLVDMQSGIEQLQNDYNSKAQQLVAWTQSKTGDLQSRDFPDTLADLLQLITDFNNFKNTEKPEKAADKLALEALYNSVNVKLRSNNRPTFVPSAGLALDDIDGLWNTLVKEERDREDALNRELERMQRFDALQRKLLNGLEKFEKWVADKQNYLAADEPVDSLNQAKEKIKAHGAFYDEYESSKSRLQELQDLNDRIAALNPSAALANKTRLDTVAGNWTALQDAADVKKAKLQKKLEIEQRKEQLRIDFAKHAKEFNRWAANTIDRVNDYSVFGETLEAVRAYGEELPNNDAEIKSEADSKKAFLDGLWAQLQELGVTDLKYTVLTDKDIEDRHARVLSVLPARRTAHAAELDRQEKLEAKRLEFASLAQDFVDHLKARRETILSLQGDPDSLVEEISNEYDDGNPEKWRLEALEEFANEMREAGINENKHTEYNATILASKSTQFGQWVQAYASSLADELSLRAQYIDKANELLGWIQSANESLQERVVDGTLAGVQDQLAQFNAYKTGPKAETAAKKPELGRLYASLQKLIKRNTRPEYVPPKGFSPDEIEALWEALNVAEQQKEAELRAELARQERLAQLVKKFNSDAEDLERWVAEKETYLASKEQINSLFAAQFAIKLYEAYNGDAQVRRPDFQKLSALKEEIVSLGYSDSAAIESRAASVLALEANLQELSTRKNAFLTQQLEFQQARENLRTEHSVLAKDYTNFIKETVQKVKLHNFAFTLEAVRNEKPQIDSEDALYVQQSNDQKAALHKLAAELGSEDGLSLSNGDIDFYHSTLVEELSARQQRYAEELNRQSQCEDLRIAFAAKAKEFVDFLVDQRSKLEVVEGTVDARIAAIKDIHNSGATKGESLIAELVELSNNLKSNGIYTNPHTAFTLPSLKSKNHQYNLYVESLITGLKEEYEMDERIKAQEAANAEIEKREELALEFSKRARELNNWMERADDLLSEPIQVDSVDEVDALLAAFSQYEKEQKSRATEYEALVQLSSQILGAGITDVSSATIQQVFEKYHNTLTTAAERKLQLSNELERQKRNEELRVEWAQKASSLHSWISTHKANLGGLKGALESQSEAIAALQVKYDTQGRALLKELDAVNVLVDNALIKGNKHSPLTFRQLTVEFEEFGASMSKQAKLISSEILSKKNADVSPEQLNEFKEVFHYFDKSGDGYLNRIEFKACLQSLGYEFTETEVDQFMASTASGEANFDEFANYMIAKNKDTDSSEEILESFRALANDNDYVTPEQLRMVLTNERVDYLLGKMPKYDGVENGYDYKKWVAEAYGGR